MLSAATQREAVATISGELDNIRAAWVNIIGAVSRATLSYYEQEGHKYVSKAFEGEYEIVSCSGNISLKEEKPMAHLHMVLSDMEYATHAGHLMPGTSAIFAGGPLERRFRDLRTAASHVMVSAWT